MADWTKLLKADPTDWLLEDGNPSVRYLTLTTILERKESHAEVKRAKADIMRTGMVPKILSRQTQGSWNGPGRFYRDKYKGTAWQLIILAEHEADGGNRQIRAACEYILNSSQDPESHGFSYDQRSGSPGGLPGGVIPCLTGNMVWSLVKLGFLGDERVRKGIEWITTYQRFDDGAESAPAGWPYDRYEMCWGRHSCHLGVVKALKALAALPVRQRNADVKRTIANACEYLLAHHIYRQSHDLEKVSKPGWLRLQFPLMYQTDILEIADLLIGLGIRDRRMDDALSLIAAKQDHRGRWSLESTLNGRFWASIENKGAPSTWITCRALKVLKRYFEQRDDDRESISNVPAPPSKPSCPGIRRTESAASVRPRAGDGCGLDPVVRRAEAGIHSLVPGRIDAGMGRNGRGLMANLTIYFGDNLDVLRRLPDSSTDLIYIDPPFNTGKVQARAAMKTVRDDAGDRTGFQGRRYRTIPLGTKSYRDIHDDYLADLEPRLCRARELLKPNGSLFFHIDYREVHYCKVLLDRLFGRQSFINEIIWAYDYGARSKSRWPPKHDTILWYARNPRAYQFHLEECDRIPYLAPSLVGPEKAARGKTPTDTWWHTIVSPTSREKTGYPTQKPLAILERIVKVHSAPGNTLLDFYAGSGTFGEAALRNGRECVLVDNNPQAMEVMARRFSAVRVEWRGWTPPAGCAPQPGAPD